MRDFARRVVFFPSPRHFEILNHQSETTKYLKHKREMIIYKDK